MTSNICPSFGFIIALGWNEMTSIRGFMRFVFRRSGALIGVYVGLVLAYGSLGLMANSSARGRMDHGISSSV